MKKTLMMSALIIFASTGVYAAQLAPAGCPATELVDRAISHTKDANEFKQHFLNMGYPVDVMYSTNNYHLTDWAKIQQIVKQKRISYSGRLCAYDNSEFGVILAPK